MTTEPATADVTDDSEAKPEVKETENTEPVPARANVEVTGGAEAESTETGKGFSERETTAQSF